MYRSDLLFSHPELRSLYTSLFQADKVVPPLFTPSSQRTVDLSLSTYLPEFFAPEKGYQTMLINTGGHWTTSIFSISRAEVLRGFFKIAMLRWVREVGDMLVLDDERNASGSKKGKLVIVRPHAAGHVECEKAKGPLEELGSLESLIDGAHVESTNEEVKVSICFDTS